MTRVHFKLQIMKQSLIVNALTMAPVNEHPYVYYATQPIPQSCRWDSNNLPFSVQGESPTVYLSFKAPEIPHEKIRINIYNPENKELSIQYLYHCLYHDVINQTDVLASHQCYKGFYVYLIDPIQPEPGYTKYHTFQLEITHKQQEFLLWVNYISNVISTSFNVQEFTRITHLTDIKRVIYNEKVYPINELPFISLDKVFPVFPESAPTLPRSIQSFGQSENPYTYQWDTIQLLYRKCLVNIKSVFLCESSHLFLSKPFENIWNTLVQPSSQTCEIFRIRYILKKRKVPFLASFASTLLSFLNQWNLQAQASIIFYNNESENIILKSKQNIRNLLHEPNKSKSEDANPTIYLIDPDFSANQIDMLDRELTKAGVSYHILTNPLPISNQISIPEVRDQASIIYARFKKNNPIPLTDPEYLIIGLAGFKDAQGTHSIGISCCCAHNGEFDQLDCFSPDEIHVLPNKINTIIEVCKKEGYKTGNFIFHLYDNLCPECMDKIKSTIINMRIPYPLYFVRISKPDQGFRWAFDLQYPDNMPADGSFVDLGEQEYLIFVNHRDYRNNLLADKDYPLPINIKVSSPEKHQVPGEILKNIINQVYHFSYVFQLARSGECIPITVYFSKHIAKTMAHHNLSHFISPIRKGKVWFL